MGTLTLPGSGLVYLDASPLIYSVEKHPDFAPLLRPIWASAKANSIEIVSSQLALLETLVGPMKVGNTALVQVYENALLGTEMRLLPLTLDVMREAARLRSSTRLRTPDAIHGATAQLSGCALFITNDAGFRGKISCPLLILADLLTP